MFEKSGKTTARSAAIPPKTIRMGIVQRTKAFTRIETAEYAEKNKARIGRLAS